jgi:hypothetical protein
MFIHLNENGLLFKVFHKMVDKICWNKSRKNEKDLQKFPSNEVNRKKLSNIGICMKYETFLCYLD